MPTGMSLWKTDLVRAALYLLTHFTTEENKTKHLWRKGQKKKKKKKEKKQLWTQSHR